MHARVAVASNALEMGPIPAHVANALHNTLVEALYAHGRLIFASTDDARTFVHAIQRNADIPQGARTRWSAMLVHLRTSGRVAFTDPPTATMLAEIDQIDRLRAGWSGQADVAVVAGELSIILGLNADTGILTEPPHKPDVAVASTASEAPAFARLQHLQQNPVAAHRSSREDFWTRVLEPLAAGAKEATILDGFLFNRITELATGQRRRSSAPEHLSWLLQHLDCVMSGGSKVRLIGNASNLRTGDDAQSIATTIRDQWMPDKIGRLTGVEVHLGNPGHSRRRFPHDRHIRFSTGSAIKIPAGFDRLREERIWDTSGMWWDYLWSSQALDGLRGDEQAAIAMARHPQASVLSR